MTAIDLHNALVAACAIESLQAYFLVLDDIMDGSLTRRGVACWYRQPNVGLKAINDGPIIESFVFWLINQRMLNFDSKHTILPSSYTTNNYNSLAKNPVMEAIGAPHILLVDKLFREVKLQTALGLLH